MTERGFSLRGLASEAGYDPSYLSKVVNGKKPCSPFIARRLDDILGAAGEITEAASRLGAGQDAEASVMDEGPVAPELVSYFRDSLAGHYRADMFLGPRNLIPTVRTQTDLIISLLPRADATVRAALLATGAAYAALPAGCTRTPATSPRPGNGGIRRSRSRTGPATSSSSATR